MNHSQNRKRSQDDLLSRLLTKGKKGILKTIFGRTTIIAVLLVLQVLLIFSLYHYVEQVFSFYMVGTLVVVGGMLLYIMNSDDNPSIKLTWAALVAVAPIPGTLFYWYTKLDPGHLSQKNKLRKIEQATRHLVLPQMELMERLKQEDPVLYQFAAYTNKFGSAPVYENTEVSYYPLGEELFAAMLDEIRKGEKFIFLEYFSIDRGELWTELLTLLIEKVKEGVEVRILYDGTCAFVTLPNHYPEELEQLGIRCKVFSPIRPVITTRYNNRDHRKICVVDGHTAFTGGVNLEDAYINREVRYGHWKDTGIQLHGDGARSFTLMFLQMWNAEENEQIYEPYLLEPGSCAVKSPGYVIPYGDSPLDQELLGEMVYMDIINRADRYLYVMTPYLILDNEMLTALTFAAKRGVDVRLILPHIPDKEYAFALAKTHYKALFQAGVKIFEYTPGFVHAKVFLCDDQRAVVGTINLDYRSLYHHFECAAYLHGVPAIKDIKADFDNTLSQCMPVTEETMRKEKLSRKILGKVLKILAPLM